MSIVAAGWMGRLDGVAIITALLVAAQLAELSKPAKKKRRRGALGGRLPRGGEFRAPDSALSADKLPRADAVYRVIGQLALNHALVPCVCAVVGELEVQVGIADFAPVRRQIPRSPRG